MITEQERQIIEQEILANIRTEKNAYKRAWRAKNKESVRKSNRKYYEKIKAKREEKRNG